MEFSTWIDGIFYVNWWNFLRELMEFFTQIDGIFYVNWWHFRRECSEVTYPGVVADDDVVEGGEDDVVDGELDAVALHDLHVARPGPVGRPVGERLSDVHAGVLKTTTRFTQQERRKCFILRLYGVRHMVKDHSDSEKGNPLPPHTLLYKINSKGSFICTIPQTG